MVLARLAERTRARRTTADSRCSRRTFLRSSRPAQRQPQFESLEDRQLLTGFVAGSIQGQDSWSGGIIPIAATVTQGVDQSGAFSRPGVGAWKVSNSTALGNHNGAFAGWPFAPGLAVTSGQPSSGAGADMLTATVYFKAGSAVVDGSNIEVDLGTDDGDDR